MKKTFALFLILVTSAGVFAQSPLTIAESVMGAYRDYYPENMSNLQWVPGDNSYYFSEMEGGVVTVYAIDISTDKKTKIVDSVSLTALLQKNGVGEINGLYGLSWTEDKMIFAHEGAYWEYSLKANEIKKTSTIVAGGANHDHNMDYSKIAFTKDNNLYIINGTDEPMAVTENEKPSIVSGQAIHRYEFGISKGTFWSPKSNLLAFYEKNEEMVTEYPLLGYESQPADLNLLKYPMAGQASHQAKVGVYHCGDKKVTYLNTGELDDHYLTNLTWSPDEKYIYLAEVNRDQNHMRLNKYDVNTGNFVSTLFEEKDNEYVEPEHGPYFLEGEEGEFLWYSERDGHNHLYHYSAEGKLLNQVTSGDIEIFDIVNYHSKSGNLIVTGTNKPTETIAYQVNVRGGRMTPVTEDKGQHNVQVSTDGRYLIDNYMSLTVPRQISVRDMRGNVVKNIFKAKNPLADVQIGVTELYTIKGEGGDDLWCRMIKPSNFDKSKKHPVLVYVYGGPHAQMVKDSWLGGASLWMHYMAERGYITFTLDNHGSNNRGIEFEQKVFRNIGDQELKDQLVGVEYLKSLPYVDADRMAIHGWSFGGFMTTSMMTRYPDAFKVGVAGGPVIDWNLYEVMYTERYMDTPQTNPEGFSKANVAQYAPNLEGDLLLIHGSVDDVVVMQNSMIFLKACIDAGKQVDFFVYPGHPHNVRGRDRVHLMTKVLNYIEDKLGTM